MSISCDVNWFDERDIDVWLAEELRINEFFCRWFLGKLGTDQGAFSLPAFLTRVSVMDESGRETDVEALFRTGDGKTYAVLVEDKIKAAFQTNQMEDYVERGERGKHDGRWQDFSVVTFAPRFRSFTVPPSVIKLTFDEASENLNPIATSDPRLIYRANFLKRAAQPNVVAVETQNPFVVEWWTAVDEMTKLEFGDFFIVDRRRFPKTTYVNLKCTHMPAYDDITRLGFRGHVYYEDGFEDIKVDIAAFRNDNEDLLLLQMQLVEQKMDEQEREFRNREAMQPLSSRCDGPFSYLMQRLSCDLTDEGRVGQAQYHAQKVREIMTTFRDELEARGFSSEGASYHLRLVMTGLNRLEAFMAEERQAQEKQDEFDLIYDGIEKNVGQLVRYAAEIDKKLCTPIDQHPMEGPIARSAD